MEKNLIENSLEYLECPTWVVTKKNIPNNFNLNKRHCNHDVKNPESLPERFDKLVLYYLLKKIFKNGCTSNFEIVTTTHQIAQNVLVHEKKFGKSKYERIMLALKKWKSILMHFDGSFYNGDIYTERYFSIIDCLELNDNNKKLYIRFNDQYVKHLIKSKNLKKITFEEYNKFTTPICITLYDLLAVRIDEKTMWQVNTDHLGKILHLRKCTAPSHVLNAIHPALEEINKKTSLNLHCDYNKEENCCLFEKVIKIIQ